MATIRIPIPGTLGGSTSRHSPARPKMVTAGVAPASVPSPQDEAASPSTDRQEIQCRSVVHGFHTKGYRVFASRRRFYRTRILATPPARSADCTSNIADVGTLPATVNSTSGFTMRRATSDTRANPRLGRTTSKPRERTLITAATAVKGWGAIFTETRGRSSSRRRAHTSPEDIAPGTTRFVEGWPAMATRSRAVAAILTNACASSPPVGLMVKDRDSVCAATDVAKASRQRVAAALSLITAVPDQIVGQRATGPMDRHQRWLSSPPLLPAEDAPVLKIDLPVQSAKHHGDAVSQCYAAVFRESSSASRRLTS